MNSWLSELQIAKPQPIAALGSPKRTSHNFKGRGNPAYWEYTLLVAAERSRLSVCFALLSRAPLSPESQSESPSRLPCSCLRDALRQASATRLDSSPLSLPSPRSGLLAWDCLAPHCLHSP